MRIFCLMMMRYALLPILSSFSYACFVTSTGALPVPSFHFTQRYIAESEWLRPHERLAMPTPDVNAAPSPIEPADDAAPADNSARIADFGLPLPPPIKAVRDPDLARALPREEFCNLLVAVAQSNELPLAFFANLIWQESRFDHRAISPVGAQGVAQFMPGTAQDVGLDNPFDARDALPASGRLLRGLRERFGNLGRAAAAYNAGPKRVLDWLAKRASLPRETRDYIRVITGEPADRWDDETPQAAVFRVPPRLPCHRVAWFSEVEQTERARMEAQRARVEAELAEKRRIAEQEIKLAALRKRKAAARRLAAKDGAKDMALTIATAEKPADDKTQKKSTDGKGAEDKGGAEERAAAKAADTKVAEAARTDTKHGETKHGETKRDETKRDEAAKRPATKAAATGSQTAGRQANGKQTARTKLAVEKASPANGVEGKRKPALKLVQRKQAATPVEKQARQPSVKAPTAVAAKPRPTKVAEAKPRAR